MLPPYLRISFPVRLCSATNTSSSPLKSTKLMRQQHLFYSPRHTALLNAAAFLSPAGPSRKSLSWPSKLSSLLWKLLQLSDLSHKSLSKLPLQSNALSTATKNPLSGSPSPPQLRPPSLPKKASSSNGLQPLHNRPAPQNIPLTGVAP